MTWLSDINNPGLAVAYSKLFDFNGSDIHSSWLDTLSISDDLKAHPINIRKNPFINRLILNELDIDDIEPLDINDPVDPLLLMTHSNLLILLSLLGTIQFQQKISHTVMSKELRALKNSIGHKNYHFAINFARLYSLPIIENNHELIALFEINPLKALECAGAYILFSAINIPEKALFKIIKYKLPTHIAQYLSSQSNVQPHNDVRKKAIKIAKDNDITCYHLLA